MADGYDYTADPAFKTASAIDQKAYLMHVDKDFAKATPRDQAAYLTHIKGLDQPTQEERTGGKVPGYLQAVRHITVPEDKPVLDSGENPRLGNPTGSLPIGREESTANTLAGIVAGMGEGQMGMPRANLRALAVDTASLAWEAGRGLADMAGSAKDAIGRATRLPGRFQPNSAPGAPPTPGQLRPWVKFATGPLGSLVSGERAANAILPAHPDPIDPRMGLNERLARLPSWQPEPAAVKPAPAAPVGTPTNAPIQFNAPLPEPGSVAQPRFAPPPSPPALRPIGGTPTAGSVVTSPMELPAPGSVPQPRLVSPPRENALAVNPSRISADLADKSPKFSGNEGRPATWTNERVIQLAKQGNRDAIAQAVRRGMELPENVRYVAGDASYSPSVQNPRDVTKFTPEGQPIRQSAQPSPPKQPGRYPTPRETTPLSEAAPEQNRPLAIQPRMGEKQATIETQRGRRFPEQDMASLKAERARAESVLQNPNRTPEEEEAAQNTIRDYSELIAQKEPPFPPRPTTTVEQAIAQGAKATEEAMPPAEEAKPLNKPLAVRTAKPKAPPLSQRYEADVLEEAQNQMRGALELSDVMPEAGRYFSENTFEEHPLAGRYNVKAGERPGGTWSGIKSQKGNIAGQYPWFNDPEISPAKLRNAIQQGKGAAYDRIVSKIADGIVKERSTATASIADRIPELRALAESVREIEPDLAQALTDAADGKISLAPDQLKAYVSEKIADAASASQFAQEIDDAAAESRQAGISETGGTSPSARERSSEASPTAQAPELSKRSRLPGINPNR